MPIVFAHARIPMQVRSRRPRAGEPEGELREGEYGARLHGDFPRIAAPRICSDYVAEGGVLADG